MSAPTDDALLVVYVPGSPVLHTNEYAGVEQVGEHARPACSRYHATVPSLGYGVRLGQLHLVPLAHLARERARICSQCRKASAAAGRLQERIERAVAALEAQTEIRQLLEV